METSALVTRYRDANVSAPNSSRAPVSLRAVSVLTLLSLSQLLVLFALQVAQANAFGASHEMDGYLGAAAAPLVLGAILSGVAGALVVPLHGETAHSHGEEVAEALLSRLGLALTGVSVAAAVGLAAFAEVAVAVLFPTFPPAQAERTASLLRILAWLVPFNTLTGFLYGVHHTRRAFLLPAAIGVAGPVCTLIVFLATPHAGVHTLAWATIGGAAVGTALLAGRFPRQGGRLPDSATPSLYRLVWRAAPLLIGATYARLDLLIDRALAGGLDEGRISQLGYAARLVTALVMLGTSGFSVIVFPEFSKRAAAGDRHGLALALAEGWRFHAITYIPVAVGVWFCGPAVIEALLQHGAFTAADAVDVARLLRLQVGVLVATGVAELAQRSYLSLGRTWLPTLLGLACFAVAVVAKVALVQVWQIDGLAVAGSGAAVVTAGLLVVCLPSAGIPIVPRGLFLTVARALVATAVAIPPAAWIMQSATPPRVFVGLLVSVTVYVAILYALQDEFTRRAFGDRHGH